MDLDEEIAEVVRRAIGTRPHIELLSALVGNLVGLATALLDAHGHDPNKSITLEAGPSGRSVTIHAQGDATR